MVLIIIGFIFIIVSLLNRNRYNPYWGLLVVLLVMGLQSNVPGDYDGYEDTYIRLANNIDRIDNLRTEMGWNILCLIFSNVVPFPIFVFLLSLFECLVLAKFIKEYADQKIMFLGALIFYFWINLMLFQMKGLRQAFSIEICLLAVMYAHNRKLIVPLLLVLFASTVHNSSLLMLPFVFLASIINRKQWKILNATSPKIIYSLIVAGIYLFIFTMKSIYIERVLPLLFSIDLNGYEGYFGELEAVDYNALITLYGAIVVFAVSYVLQAEKGFRKYLSFLFLISAFWEMFTFGAGNMFRLSLYFSITSVVVLPNVSSYLYDHKHHVLAWLFAVLVLSYSFRTFITQTLRHSEDGFDNYSFIIFNL